MKIGVTLPQGVEHEFRGLEPARAWDCLRQVALRAEELGFESVWLYDHFTCHPPDASEDLVLESFTTLSALTALTKRVRLGHLVLCAAFRNAALTAKMICTLDTISGGRIELGIGAGWKQDEWIAYGYGFPEIHERLAILADHLEVITGMLGPGRATWSGSHALATEAVNVPKPLQKPRLPIIVGGNGKQVTWRLAARFADELNLDDLTPAEVAEAIPVIATRCREVGRDPASLRVSVHASGPLTKPGPKRIAVLQHYADVGLSRVMVKGNVGSMRSDSYLEELWRDARNSGVLEA